MILDARAAERYRGEVEPVDPVAGHIPTAHSAPATGNLGPDGRFLPPDQLAARFAAIGDESGPVVVLVRQRNHGLAQRARDARRRPARPDPLPRLVQRLVPFGGDGGDGV